MRKLYYGSWGISLYNEGRLVAQLLYPCGPQGPVETDNCKSFAQGWKNGHELDSLISAFPYVEIDIVYCDECDKYFRTDQEV